MFESVRSKAPAFVRDVVPSANVVNNAPLRSPVSEIEVGVKPFVPRIIAPSASVRLLVNAAVVELLVTSRQKLPTGGSSR